MKKILLLSLLLALVNSFTSYAGELPTKQGAVLEQYGNVLSKTPLIEQIGTLSRLAGYRVVYEYAGKQYTVLMQDDPGSQVIILSPPSDTNPAPVVKMTAAVPVKLPTAAEVQAATTLPVIVEPMYLPPFGFWNPYYSWYPYSYPGYWYGPGVGVGWGFRFW